jgi:hypothetical protein
MSPYHLIGQRRQSNAKVPNAADHGIPRPMKFVEPSQFTDPNVAARKLVEIANGIEAVQDGRIFIELVNGAFLEAGGTPDQYRAALARAITLGWLWRHESGAYVKFTPAGAEMFA